MVSKDVAPYCNAIGDRARVHGLNLVGLKRRGLTREQIESIKRAYRIIFRSGLSTREALARVKRDLPGSGEAATMVAFIETSQRGICR